MRKALGVALAPYFGQQDYHHLFCGDIGFGVFDDVRRQTPGQFHNFGISEQHMVSYAAAFASAVKATSMVYTINPFITSRVHDQLRVDVAYANAPLVICSVGAGFAYDALGFTHYGIEDLALMTVLPNFRIFTPAEPADVTAIIRQLFSDRAIAAPCYLRLQKGGERNLSADFPDVERKGSYKYWPGDEVEIVTHGAIAEEALKARQMLKGDISVAVRAVIDWGRYCEDEVMPIQDNSLFLEEHRAVGSLANALVNAGKALPRASAPLRLKCVRHTDFHGLALRPTALRLNGLDAASIAHSIKELKAEKRPDIKLEMAG